MERTRIVTRIVGVCFGLGLTLSACSNAPPMQRLPDMTFLYKPPIRLNIARVEVVSEYSAPTVRPNIEYDMPVSPEAAVRKWAQDRLKPVGKEGILRIVIHKASATETPLQTDQGLSGMFKKEQAARVDENLDVTLQMLDDHQFTVADVSGKAFRSRTEPEDQKLNQRDQLLYDLTYDLVRGFDEEVEPNIRTGFNKWLDGGM
jgi:hypothetical protein